MRRKKARINQILTVHVRIGESDDPEGRTVRWKAEKDIDLILDQFGVWLAGLIRPVPGVGVDKSVTMKDITNTSRTVKVYASTAWFNTNTAGTKVGVGSSSQSPARTDYNLISQLGTLENTSDGVWTSADGKIVFTGSILLSAGGTVREVGFFGYWYYVSALGTFMLFRDTISDVVIAAGKYAHVEYTIQC